MIDDHDGLVRRSFEQLSNTTSRHRFLDKAAKGIFATMSALALGEIGVKAAFADTCQTPNGNKGACSCCATHSTLCGGCPSSRGCPTTGYDRGQYQVCTLGTCSYCWYSSGYWCCPCGTQTSYCTDCVFYNANLGGIDCSTACTCNTLQ